MLPIRIQAVVLRFFYRVYHGMFALAFSIGVLKGKVRYPKSGTVLKTMIRKLALSLLLTVSACAYRQDCFAITYNDFGSSTTYNLSANDSLHIVSGTYTGNISNFPSGAKISVSDIATFQPIDFPNGAAGSMFVYGTVIFNYNIRTNTNFQLNNYGIFSVDGTVTMSGNSQMWINNFGAVINFIGAVTVNTTTEANSVLNYGTINSSSTLTMTSGALIVNYKNLNVTGEFRVNGGTLENQGKLYTTGLLNFNNGAAIIRNYCGMSSSGGIRNTSNNFYNYSYLWAKNDLGLGNITNSGTIYNVNWQYENHTMAIIHGKNFTQTSGSILGKGWMYFYGTTTQSGGTTGTPGVTTDTLKMNDITRVNTSIFYDPPPPALGGTINPSAIYNVWGVPDSTRAYFIGCSLEIILEIPLAINWNYFYVELYDDIPLLNWSAEYQEGTVFEIQRSYDGRNFTGIKQLPVDVGRSQYTYNDNSVNSNLRIAYYRIVAIEPGGNKKFTQIKNVRFNSQPGSLHIYPNPFASNFMIDYNAKENENVIVKIFNAAGQQKLAKNISVHKGTNSIQINEALHFSKGVYIIQVSNGSSIIASSKIIKQ